MLDRKLQRELLEVLLDRYPESCSPREISVGRDPDAVLKNIAYLDAHGLAEANLTESFEGTSLGMTKATAKGIDFLADDGGLSAILGVVTVKLHDDTIKALVEQRIQASDLPPEEKRRWLDQLRELPGETTKHLVLKLVDLGLEKGPEAIAALGKFLG